ncbi:hypothetical protein OIU78_028858 [Salix suchowensis]|nr:hypothetical protein OIU78_028858 [Salix suchowensis]
MCTIVYNRDSSQPKHLNFLSISSCPPVILTNNSSFFNPPLSSVLPSKNVSSLKKNPQNISELYYRTTATVVLFLFKPSSPPPIISMITETLIYYLSQHPAIVTFRWSHIQSWGSTWSFVLTSIAFYLTFCALVHLFLQTFIKRGRTVPLGPIPAVYSLFMALISAVIFSGILLSTASEIQETRWFWRRSKTPFQWLLCFPLGTRPSGRVFFWSYMYYLSRPGDSISNLGVLHCLRLQILDCCWFALRVFSFCGELPDCAAGMQCCLPCGGAFAAFHERWV